VNRFAQRLRSGDVTLCALLALALATSPDKLAGQEASPQRRFFIEGTVGYGLLDNSCDTCSEHHSEGVSLATGLSLRVSAALRLGVESQLWLDKARGLRRSASFATLTGWIEPPRLSHVTLSAGLGLCRYRDDPFSGVGLGGRVGLSYDLPVSHRLVVTPSTGFSIGAIGRLYHGTTSVADGWSQRIADFSVGLRIN